MKMDDTTRAMLDEMNEATGAPLAELIRRAVAEAWEKFISAKPRDSYDGSGTA